MNRTQPRGEDWLSNRRVAWLWPAAFATVLLGWLLVPGIAGDVIAGTGFAVAGGLCVGNTSRCRRVHCAMTGPLYLVAAGLFFGRARGVSIEAGWIMAAAVIGTAIAFVPELFGKRYLDTARQTRRP